MNEMDNECVAGLGTLDVEGTGLRITAEDALDAVHVAPTSVYRRCVDGISRSDCQNRLVERRELTVVDRRHKLMTLQCSVFEHRRGRRAEAILQWMGLIGGGFDRSSGDNSALDRRINFGRSTVIAGGQQMKVGSAD